MMRTLSFILIAGIYACSNSTANNREENATAAQSKPRKVLLELFTSQGCSSCPPADRLVSNLAQTDTNLIVLSFHVDYWDRLGWKDAFSNHEYTLRQRQYVQALHAKSAYTPQAVVQGQHEMVGSNKPGISNALAKAKQQTADLTLTADATMNGDLVNVHYNVDKMVANQQIAIALVQTHASTAVAGGENAGAKLTDYNIVRDLAITPLSAEKGNTQIHLPADVKKENASAIVFVQDVSSKRIITAAQVSF